MTFKRQIDRLPIIPADAKEFREVDLGVAQLEAAQGAQLVEDMRSSQISRSPLSLVRARMATPSR